METKYKDIRDDSRLLHSTVYVVFYAKKKNWKIKILDVINASKAGRF